MSRAPASHRIGRYDGAGRSPLLVVVLAGEFGRADLVAFLADFHEALFGAGLGGSRFGLLIDTRQAGVADGRALSGQIAAWMRERNELFRECSLGTAIVTAGLGVRLLLELVFAVQKPASETRVCNWDAPLGVGGVRAREERLLGVLAWLMDAGAAIPSDQELVQIVSPN